MPLSAPPRAPPNSGHDVADVVFHVWRSKTEPEDGWADVRYLKNGAAAAKRALRGPAVRPLTAAPRVRLNSPSIARTLTDAARAAVIKGD